MKFAASRRSAITGSPHAIESSASSAYLLLHFWTKTHGYSFSIARDTEMCPSRLTEEDSSKIADFIREHLWVIFSSWPAAKDELIGRRT